MKDSGVTWIGSVPREWTVLRGKDIFAKRSLPAFDADEIVTCFRDGQVTLRRNRREDGFTIALKEHGYQGVRVGDLVVHAMDAFAGAIGISDSNGKCSPVYSICRARFQSKTDLRFYSYVLRDMALNGYIQSVGLGIRERSTDFRFREIEAAFYCQPTFNEQRTIADYLDQQTALIDQRLSTLEEKKTVLSELRKATIHEAVTKGLNKNVSMKDSGVAWIGEIPEGWVVYTLKSVATVNDEVLSESVTSESIIEYVDIGAVSADKGIEFTQPMVFRDAPSRARRLVKHGDVIISTVRTYLRAIAPIINPPANLVVSTGFAVIRARKKVIPEFVAYSLQDENFMSQVTARSIGVSYPAINANELMSIQIVVPPAHEQHAIAAYLDQQTQQIDVQLTTLDEQAQVLKELRKAIIHEAVTGKVDLSGMTGAGACSAVEKEGVITL